MNHSFFGRPSQLVVALVAATTAVPFGALAQTAPATRAAPAVRAKPASPSAASPMAQAPGTQGLAAGKSAASGDVVAKVGNTNISGEEMRAYIAALSPRDQAALAKDPALLSQAVRMLLANRLVLQEVTAKKWDQQPNVAAQLDRVR